jgi:hypothetical protein
MFIWWLRRNVCEPLYYTASPTELKQQGHHCFTSAGAPLLYEETQEIPVFSLIETDQTFRTIVKARFACKKIRDPLMGSKHVTRYLYSY